MRLLDLLRQAERVKHPGNVNLVIPVFNPGTLGGSPCVDVQEVNIGFDWDNGKLFLVPNCSLTVLTAEQMSDVQQCAKVDQSPNSYKMHKRIKELEAELQAMKEMFHVECPKD